MGLLLGGDAHLLAHIADTADGSQNLLQRLTGFLDLLQPLICYLQPVLCGLDGSGGAIAIYTRRGGDTRSEPGKGLPNDIVMGYTELREFYSPNYSSYRPENERKDLRTTLYWNPQVVNAAGSNKVKLTFYNNDVSQSFRIIIQGMTKDGRLAFLEEIME